MAIPNQRWLKEKVRVEVYGGGASLFENVHVHVDYQDGWLTLEKENFEPVAVFAPGSWANVATIDDKKG